FKMTWHPNWNVYLDGVRQPVAMLSPGFPGVAIPAGRHRIEFRYEPGPLKPVLAVAGLLLAGLLGIAGRRFSFSPVYRIPARLAANARVAAGIAVLALPVVLPLFTSGVLTGHDAFEYFPRVVEAQQNFKHGIALLRWAPDLGHGYGQPLFIFRP